MKEEHEKSDDAQERVLLETKERLKAEEDVKIEQKAKEAAQSDADTAFDGR